MNVSQFARSTALLASLTLFTACGGGGGGGGPAPVADSGCTGFCATTSPQNLTVADVQQVIAQAALEAQNKGVDATIAVTDRVGNVLALYSTTGSNGANITIASGLVDPAGVPSGLENVTLGIAGLAAIAKAVTGSYLASEGNAFSTRTASQIVQEHFNPHETGAPGGPLFGVQFSQLPCGDLVNRGGFTTNLAVGPRRSPLGMSADPGGLPLYKSGVPVGAIGVMSDGMYSLDRSVLDTDSNIDEIIAVAGSFGYGPPDDRRANRITVDGRSLRFSDADESASFLSTSLAALAAAPYPPAVGGLIADEIGDYNSGVLRAGTTFGQMDSGVQSDGDTYYPGLDAFVLTSGGVNQYPPTTDGAMNSGEQLLAAEVQRIIQGALGVANRARGQIRRPLGSQARVTVSVVDIDGNILAIARTRDAPLFGTDVSLQKARTATFFSSDPAENDLDTAPNADSLMGITGYDSPVSAYPAAARSFLGVTAGNLTGNFAFADRSGGNLSRPFYPDGNDVAPLPNNGPFSKPYTGNTMTNEWSPFSTGLQLDLVLDRVVAHLATGADNTSCTEFTTANNPIPNGIQIFPGSVPIFKNGVLVGGIGVSGDGIEQDDMISFLGLHEASVAAFNASAGGSVDGKGGVGAGFGNAPIAVRADQIPPNPTNPLASTIFNQRLRYIQCPNNPFLNSSAEMVCDGL